MKKIVLTLCIWFSGLLGLRAEMTIDITEGNFNPVPIAVTDFSQGSDPAFADLGKKISDVISADLARSGLFKTINPQAFIQTAAQVMQQPDFVGWKVLNAEAVVGGMVKKDGAQIRVDFRLFDIYTQSQLAGLSLASDQGSWRRLAHKIADAIYERITGDKGYFDTRIVYIAQKGTTEKDVQYRLALMDQDGENHQFLTSGQNMVLTPRFSPDGKQIVYLDYGKNHKSPHLYLFDLSTGKNQSLGNFPGLSFSPRFSPDGKTLIMSIADKGVTSLYTLAMGSRKVTRLTKSTGSIDTSPCYSPDGSQIVFVSDRGGKPNLYIMPASGGEPERITFGAGNYLTASWSPRGDMIAFTKQKGGFYAGVIRPDGSGERMIAQDYLVEAPTWSPNGRLLLYTRQSSNRSAAKLYAVDVTGFNEYVVTTPGNATYGTWSPLID